MVSAGVPLQPIAGGVLELSLATKSAPSQGRGWPFASLCLPPLSSGQSLACVPLLVRSILLGRQRLGAVICQHLGPWEWLLPLVTGGCVSLLRLSERRTGWLNNT